MAKAQQIEVGDIICAVLLEGARENDNPTPDDIAGRYPNAPEDEIKEALSAVDSIKGGLNPLYIDTGETKIVADVGFGVGAQPEMGNMIPSLATIGVKPEDIDLVYITHFHGDHIAGLVDENGNPVYANARYMTTEAEWDEWMGDRWKDADDEGSQKNFNMMQALHDKFILAGEGDEVADGVTIVSIPGHTLGQSALLIESDGQRMIHLADVLHSESQFKYTDWHFRYDSDPELAVKTRKSILKRCADEDLLTLFYHLEFPSLGHIKVDGDAFTWHPIET